MKVLKNVEIDAETFDIINDRRSPRQLYRLNENDQYTLALFDGRERVFSFESAVMTELLCDLGGGVRDVTLVEFKEPEFGRNSECGFEIRLYLDSDDVIGITHTDDVRFYLTRHYKEHIADLSMEPVTELWELPLEKPFIQLEISVGLKKQLDPYIENSSPDEVIRRLWSDYQNALTSKCNQHDRECALLVYGEFVNFTASAGSDNRIYMHHVYES